METYGLMHKDRMVCIFVLDENEVLSVQVNEQFKGHMPVSVVDKKSFQTWLHYRAIPATRIGIHKVCQDTFSYMLQNYGLSLTDCYWVKPFSAAETWEELNFYQNGFRATTVMDTLESTDLLGKRNYTPSASLSGDLQKKWIMQGQRRVLVKGNYGNTALQSVSEVLATKIYQRQQNMEYTAYRFIDLKSNGSKLLGCCCDNFTSEALEFVPAIDVVNFRKKRQDQSNFQLFVEICLQNGIQNVVEFMSNMFVVDFLIANTDRHLNNFGILRNPDTLQWVRMAPVFDSGNSLFYYYPVGLPLPTGRNLLKTKIASFTNTLAEHLRNVGSPTLNLTCLPTEKEYLDVICCDKSLQNFDIDQRILLLKNTKRYLEDFLNGAKVWNYQY